MQAVTTIGLDIAKSVFQVHGVDAAGQLPSEFRHQYARVCARVLGSYSGEIPPIVFVERPLSARGLQQSSDPLRGRHETRNGAFRVRRLP
jgi:hypothetical protein